MVAQPFRFPLLCGGTGGGGGLTCDQHFRIKPLAISVVFSIRRYYTFRIIASCYTRTKFAHLSNP